MHQEILLAHWLLRLVDTDTVIVDILVTFFIILQVEQDGSVFIKKIFIHGSPTLDLDQLTKRKKCWIRNSALALKPIISNTITKAARTMLRRYQKR